MRNGLTATSIASAITGSAVAQERGVSVEKVFDEGDVLMLNLGSHGDLRVFVTANDDEIRLTTPIAPVGEIGNRPEFNERVLRMGRLLPLSSFSIGDYAEGESYELINEMPATSSIDDVLHELQVLGGNALEAAEAVVAWKSAHAA